MDYREVRSRYDRSDVHQTNVRNLNITRINIYNRQENAKRNLPVRSEVHATNEPKNPPVKRELPPAENNVYAGQDGSVYRRTETGWETRDAKGWSQVKTLPEPRQELKPDEHAENMPQHVEEPRQEPVRQAPVQENPGRETPAREPARAQPPERVEQPSLDEERAARERPAYSGGGGEAHSAPVEQHGGGGGEVHSAPVEQHGGGGGGGNGAGTGGGGGGAGGRQR